METENKKFELEVERLGYGAVGIARTQEGMVCLIPKSLPGERICAEVVREKRRHLELRLDHVIRASDKRVAAPCEYFEACGGCQIQHLNYPDQLQFKQQHFIEECVRDDIPTSDIDLKMVAIEAAEPQLAYRNRNLFHFNGTDFGFVDPTSAALLDIERCICGPERSNQVVGHIRTWLQNSGSALVPDITGVLVRTHEENDSSMLVLVIDATFQNSWLKCEDPLSFYKLDALIAVLEPLSLFVTFKQRLSKQSYGKDFIHVHGEKRFVQSVGGYELQLSPTSFAQIHLAQTEKLYSEVAELIKIKKPPFLLDLYSGSGVLSFFLAQHAKRVLGLELNRQAVSDAKLSARANRINNVDYRVGKCDTLVERLYRQGIRTKIATLNPPRPGAPLNVLTGLKQMGVQDLIYISCSPPTWRRDVKRLYDLGYRLKHLKLFDMFPQTYHLELLSCFELDSN